MANRKKDKQCVDIRICLSIEADEAIEKFQAIQRIKGLKLKKPEAAEQLIEKLILDHPRYYES